MSQRLQLALNVDNIDEAVSYYGKLFGAEPAKRKPGYANFAIENPPLKLVLFEVPGEANRINHLGVEVTDEAEVAAAIARLESAGIAELKEEASTCCYATQDKVWSTDPQGTKWEFYRVLDDSETFGEEPVHEEPAPQAPAPVACCA